MFFHIVLERNMQLHPRHFGRDLREKLVAKLMKDVEGTCSGRHGFVVAITGIESVGKGLIRDGTGFVTFPVKYQCVVFRPFKGEILEAVVTMVNKVVAYLIPPIKPEHSVSIIYDYGDRIVASSGIRMGFFAEAGPVQIFVSNHLIPDDMEFQSGDMPNYTTSDRSVRIVLMQVKIEKESEVRLKIIGTRVDATEIVYLRGNGRRKNSDGAIICWSQEVFSGYREMNCIPWCTYTYVLKACVGSETLGWWLLRGKEIQAHMLQHGYEVHVHVKNVVSWSAIIACYVKTGKAFEALELFREMMMLETLASVPNSVTMVSVLQACAALAALEQVMNTHVCKMCYGIHGFGTKAIKAFNEMAKESLLVPYNSLVFLELVAVRGLLRRGNFCFGLWLKEHRIYSSVAFYACMVDILGRANRLDEAAKVTEDMRIEPGKDAWGSLLGARQFKLNGIVESLRLLLAWLSRWVAPPAICKIWVDDQWQ
ncbi:hypothetical protein RHSIM_Rhsim10G0155100 [Rhododendron simsii]|uniref:RNA polymerase Rpb7-like N-terminal domain-containing protein n=1 Tax=Rhododendron simsii TaxID=118357 RepID=A0A834LDY7_RHOSS|nr:hypothetical protein RHSIM_Rhsim10G0155100 [Rhododendron simsii]